MDGGIGRKRPLASSSSSAGSGTSEALSSLTLRSAGPLQHQQHVHLVKTPAIVSMTIQKSLRYIIPVLALVVVVLQARNGYLLMQNYGDGDRGLRIEGDFSSSEHRISAESQNMKEEGGRGRRKLNDEAAGYASIDYDENNPTRSGADESIGLFPESMNKLVTDMAIISRRQFARTFDIGYALDSKMEGNSQVLLLYANQTQEGNEQRHSGALQRFSIDDATQQCKTMKVVLTDPDPKKQTCIAIIGQWSSYHVHKFKRHKRKKQKTDESNTESKENTQREDDNKKETADDIQSKYEWKYESGRKSILPTPDQQEANRLIMIRYLSSYPAALERLRPIADLVSRGGSMNGEQMPITLLLSNYGQSRFLMNYICTAKARNIDTSRTLLVATDEETDELGKALGLATFYDKQIFGFFPKERAQHYHDRSYILMMMTKVFSVHLVNALGHDLLFSDVDIALYSDPMEYFYQQSAEYDAFFQHDGYHHPERFAPLAANTGFYYVQNNERTRYFFSLFIRMGDIVIMERSHQAALNTLINEQMSLHGLRVKVIGEDHKLFLSGYHFHADSKVMRKLKEGRHEPYIFHANWLPGEEKMPVLMETNNWFVKSKCLDKSFSDLAASVNDISNCCLSSPAQDDTTPTK